MFKDFCYIYSQYLTKNQNYNQILNYNQMKPRGSNTQKQIKAVETAAQQKIRLLNEIKSQKQMSEQLNFKVKIRQKQLTRIVQSNQRNIKRLMRYKQKYENLWSHRNQPEYFLYFCGYMNEYMQEFMLSHDQQVMNPNQEVNPDNMSYEQLLQLGESIGKVSKGISKEQFEALQRWKNTLKDDKCPICCTQFEYSQMLIKLPCKHLYHQECIMEWLKDENACPTCKKSVLDI